MVFKTANPKENLFSKDLKRFSFGLAVLETILVRRRIKTQRYEGALFENLRVVGPNYAQLKTKQSRKEDSKTRNKDQNKVNCPNTLDARA